MGNETLAAARGDVRRGIGTGVSSVRGLGLKAFYVNGRRDEGVGERISAYEPRQMLSSHSQLPPGGGKNRGNRGGQPILPVRTGGRTKPG